MNVLRAKWSFVMLGLALTWSTGLFAADDTEMSLEYSTCIEKTNGANPEMIDCMVAETARQDIRLNENYKKLISKLADDRKKALIEAQRAWIKFRETNCSFYDDPAGGQSAILTAKECFLSATADRATELESLVYRPH
jgi:uncharacterized protein YecT (DUF1311 family)